MDVGIKILVDGLTVLQLCRGQKVKENENINFSMFLGLYAQNKQIMVRDSKYTIISDPIYQVYGSRDQGGQPSSVEYG